MYQDCHRLHNLSLDVASSCVLPATSPQETHTCISVLQCPGFNGVCFLLALVILPGEERVIQEKYIEC